LQLDKKTTLFYGLVIAAGGSKESNPLAEICVGYRFVSYKRDEIA
jgi:hypothetical protein